MELVYLWVEDYKNIQKQGFNFSPRFRCKFKDEYDEDGKLKKDCELEIIDKEETGEFYPKNFFGDNINITAIVGENGSGKSSILEFLLDIIAETEISNKYIICYSIQNINYYFSNISIDNKSIFKQHKKLGENIFSIFIDYSIDSFQNEAYRTQENFIYKNNQNFIIEPNKFSQNNLNINIDLDNEKSQKRLVSYYSKLKDNEKFKKEFFVPREVIIRIDPRRVFEKKDNKRKNLKGDYLSNAKSWQEIIELNNIYLKDNKLSEEEKEKANNVKSFIDILEKNSYKKDFFSLKTTDNIKKQNGVRLNFSEFEDYFLLEICNLPRYFLIDFETENGVAFSKLSTGEKTIQKIIYLIIDYIELSKKDTFLILIDEVELYIHPTWQKQYISKLFSFADIYKNKKINFIVTSHSPFILSDLPKENVIFLEKDEKTGKCVNATEKMKDFNTFGANIHTLLSHGFFMKDGLMGEFAKSKISKILNFLNGTNKFIDTPINQIKPTIELIGEDFLREKLLKMYDEKFKIKSKDDEIKELKAEIERLKNAKNKI